MNMGMRNQVKRRFDTLSSAGEILVDRQLGVTEECPPVVRSLALNIWDVYVRLGGVGRGDDQRGPSPDAWAS